MFGKKRNGIHHAAHIKGNTAGTSNEISFSVLDAAKMSMGDDPNELSDDVKGFGKISLFTLGNKSKSHETPKKREGITLPSGNFVETGGGAQSAGASAGSVSRQTTQISSSRAASENEISRRKAVRKKSRRKKVILGCMGAVALAALLAVSFQYIYDQNQTAGNKIQSALQKVVQADITLVKMDRVLSNPIDESSLEGIDELYSELDTAEKNLNSAQSAVNQAVADTTVTTDAETMNYAVEAVASRLTMLETGRALLEKVRDTQEALSLTSSAYNQIYVADALAREAARFVSGELTAAKLVSSREKLKAAIEELISARTKLEAVYGFYPIDEVSDYLEYVNLRITALEHGVASDNALLDDNTSLALQENDLYTECDSRAAGLAAQFPSDWLEPIRAAFDEESQPQVKAYETARSEAGVTDAFLRNYLGTKVK